MSWKVRMQNKEDKLREKSLRVVEKPRNKVGATARVHRHRACVQICIRYQTKWEEAGGRSLSILFTLCLFLWGTSVGLIPALVKFANMPVTTIGTLQSETLFVCLLAFNHGSMNSNSTKSHRVKVCLIEGLEK